MSRNVLIKTTKTVQAEINTQWRCKLHWSPCTLHVSG